MANDWLELCSGGVPISMWFRMTLQDLKDIAEKAPDTRGINRQLELCFIGLTSYFEAFCKDLFAFSINLYPPLLKGLREARREISIDPIYAIEMGERFRDRVGSLVAERFDFGTPKAINELYGNLLKITPFSTEEVRRFEEILRDRNLIVHHGGTYTFRYLEQAKLTNRDYREEAHWLSLVVDKTFYLGRHQFVEDVARKMLKAAHDRLAEYGQQEFGITDNAPVESLLAWDDQEPTTLWPSGPA